MSRRKSKKLNTAALAVAVVALIGLVVAIVGLFVDWMGWTELENPITATLKDLADGRNPMTEALHMYDGYDTMYAFALITVIAGGIGFICATASVLFRVKIIKFVAMIVCAIALVSAIVTIICTYSFCGNDFYKLLDPAPAIGAWLLTIGGAVCGLAGAAATIQN